MARIGLDLDGTVADYTRALHATAVAHKIINPTEYVEPTTYDMVERGWFASSEEFLRAHKILCAMDGGLGSLNVLEPNINTAIRKWKSQGHEVIAVTARLMRDHDEKLRKKVIQDTHNLVSKNTPDLDDVAVVRGGTKADINADVYIDDSPHEIRNLSGAGKTVLIRHQKYNKNMYGARVFTMHTVDAALEKLS